MKIETVKIEDLIEIPEFRDFYSLQPIEELIQSYKLHGQTTPIHITEKYEIVDGYRRVTAIKMAGGKTVIAIIIDSEPDIQKRMVFNQYRQKTTQDQIREIREVFTIYPKRQGQKNPDGERLDRDQLISNSLGNKWKGDVIINKLEYILNNDLEGDVLSKGIIEKGWKVDPSYEFLKDKMIIDQEKGYGFTQQLVDGTFTVADVNKLISQRQQLDIKHDYTFVIPEKANSYHMDCIDLANIDNLDKTVDLIITSIPYWDLRTYKTGQIRQLGQEETKEEYAMNVAKIFIQLIPILKESANVIINVGETYRNGVAQGIPFLLKEYIDKYVTLFYKDNMIWSKINPRPQSEDVKRPVNSIEYLLWFVVDPKKSKYNLLTFPVEGKQPKVTNGAKDVASNGKQSKKSKSISKPYGKITSHIYEQDIWNIIKTSIGKNHDIFKISETGHPAAMSPMLPVTLILMLSDETDLVCDPFAGSNVVGKISLELNRRSVSAELSKEYYDIGCEMLIKGNENFDRESLDIINEMVYDNSLLSNNSRIAA